MPRGVPAVRRRRWSPCCTVGLLAVFVEEWSNDSEHVARTSEGCSMVGSSDEMGFDIEPRGELRSSGANAWSSEPSYHKLGAWILLTAGYL